MLDSRHVAHPFGVCARGGLVRHRAFPILFGGHEPQRRLVDPVERGLVRPEVLERRRPVALGRLNEPAAKIVQLGICRVGRFASSPLSLLESAEPGPGGCPRATDSSLGVLGRARATVAPGLSRHDSRAGERHSGCENRESCPFHFFDDHGRQSSFDQRGDRNRDGIDRGLSQSDAHAVADGLLEDLRDQAPPTLRGRSKTPAVAAAGAIPRRSKRPRSRSRARASLPLTLPSGHSSCRAASSWVSPCK